MVIETELIFETEISLVTPPPPAGSDDNSLNCQSL